MASMYMLRKFRGQVACCPHLTLDSELSQDIQFIVVGPDQRLALCGVCHDVLLGHFAADIIEKVVERQVLTTLRKVVS